LIQKPLTLIDHEDERLVVVGVEIGVLHGRLLLLADTFAFLEFKEVR
jgi:hypothetical protein